MKNNSRPTLNINLAVPVVTKWTTFLIVVKSGLQQSIEIPKSEKLLPRFFHEGLKIINVLFTGYNFLKIISKSFRKKGIGT